LKNSQEALEELEKVGVRVEDDNKMPLQVQLRTRKDELEQLMILLTESQLPKHPLTISKLLPSLPKTNPLVRQYLQLKKEQAHLINKYTTYLAKITERIDFFKSDSKRQRKDQIRDNSEKPSPSEIKDLIEHIKQSHLDLSR
jgi:transposase